MTLGLDEVFSFVTAGVGEDLTVEDAVTGGAGARAVGELTLTVGVVGTDVATGSFTA